MGITWIWRRGRLIGIPAAHHGFRWHCSNSHPTDSNPLWLLSEECRALYRAAGPRPGFLHGVVAFPAVLSSAMGSSGHAGTRWDNWYSWGESHWRDQLSGGWHEESRSAAAAASAGLTQPEREFFLELRRLTDVAGFTYRALEELTSSSKPAAGDPCFYGKSQWGRWLNGQSMPPRNAVRRLAEILAAEGIAAGHLLHLWTRTFVPAPPEEAEPDGSQAVPSQRPSAAAHVDLQPSGLPSLTWAGALVGRDSETALLTGLIRRCPEGAADRC